MTSSFELYPPAMTSLTTRYPARSVLDKSYEAERKYMSTPENQRDFQPIADILAPNYKLEQTSALPYAGTYLGSKGMQEWMRQMASYFDVVDVQRPEFFENDGDCVVVVSNLHLRVRHSGVEADFPLCQVVTVDLDNGQLVRMQPFYWDVHRLNQLVGYVHG